MNNKISIIIPVYNVQEYLPKCLTSVINQTYKNLEIIVVDDGSTDGSGQICDRFARKDNRIIVIHKENEGQSSARNVALDIATGDYIGFVDSDDYCDETMFSKMMDCMLKNNVEIVICGTYKFNEKGECTKFQYFEDDRIIQIDEARRLVMSDYIKGYSWDKLFKANVWENIKYPQYNILEDAATTYKPFFKSNKDIGYISEPLYYYIYRNGSSLHKNSKQTYYGMYNAWKERAEFAKVNIPECLNYCLERAGKSAVDVLTGVNVFDDDKNAATVCEAREFIKEHKSLLLHSKNISIETKARIILILISEDLYYDILKIRHLV